MTVVSLYKVCVCVLQSYLGSWGKKKILQSGKPPRQHLVHEDCIVVMESQLTIQNYLGGVFLFVWLVFLGKT